MGNNNYFTLSQNGQVKLGSKLPSFTLLIILLLSIVVGMIFALVIRPKDKYHGPNSKEVRKQIFYDPKKNKCFRFDVKIIACSEGTRLK